MEIKTAVKKLCKEAEDLRIASRNYKRLARLYAFATMVLADVNVGEIDKAVRHARILLDIVKSEGQIREKLQMRRESDAYYVYLHPWSDWSTWRAVARKIERYIGVLEQ